MLWSNKDPYLQRIPRGRIWGKHIVFTESPSKLSKLRFKKIKNKIKTALTNILHRQKIFKTEQRYKQIYTHTHTISNKPGTGDIIELIMSKKPGGCCGRSRAHCLPLVDRPWCDIFLNLYFRILPILDHLLFICLSVVLLQVHPLPSYCWQVSSSFYYAN